MQKQSVFLKSLESGQTFQWNGIKAKYKGSCCSDSHACCDIIGTSKNEGHFLLFGETVVEIEQPQMTFGEVKPGQQFYLDNNRLGPLCIKLLPDANRHDCFNTGHCEYFNLEDSREVYPV